MRPLPTIPEISAQNSPPEPEWAENTAFQWNLLANIQKKIKDGECADLLEYAATTMTFNELGQLSALKFMLKTHFSQVLDHGEQWLNEHDSDVQVLQCFL